MGIEYHHYVHVDYHAWEKSHFKPVQGIAYYHYVNVDYHDGNYNHVPRMRTVNSDSMAPAS